MGIRSVGKYSGHHHDHHCHHCSVPVSLFMKWRWPNQLVLFSYINWLEPSAHAECADHKSEFFPGWPKSTRSNLMQRKITIAISAATLVPNFPIWKPTREFTAERNCLFVHSATTNAIELAGLESTCESTLEESLIIANSANIPPHFLKRHILTHSWKKALSLHPLYLFLQTHRGVTSKEHLSTHSEERRFSCDQCSYSCIKANDI